MNKKVFIQLIFLSLLFLVSIVSVWHMSVSFNNALIGITESGGLFKIPTRKAILFSEYGVVLSIVIYNAFVIYLILNQRNTKK